jgi:hypothetical protein
LHLGWFPLLLAVVSVGWCVLPSMVRLNSPAFCYTCPDFVVGQFCVLQCGELFFFSLNKANEYSVCCSVTILHEFEGRL